MPRDPLGPAVARVWMSYLARAEADAAHVYPPTPDSARATGDWLNREERASSEAYRLAGARTQKQRRALRDAAWKLWRQP